MVTWKLTTLIFAHPSYYNTLLAAVETGSGNFGCTCSTPCLGKVGRAFRMDRMDMAEAGPWTKRCGGLLTLNKCCEGSGRTIGCED